ncbi:MAG: DUF4157 domain-containing protein [Pseudomonadota bacterium]
MSRLTGLGSTARSRVRAILQAQSSSDNEHAADQAYAKVSSDTNGIAPSSTREASDRDNTQTAGRNALSRTSRRYFESTLGGRYGAVRIRNDRTAHALTRQLGARAITAGNEIAFAEGAFRPDTREGRGLIAHELTHVEQRCGVGGPAVQAKLDATGYNGADKAKMLARALNAAETLNDAYPEIATMMASSPRVFDVVGSTEHEVLQSLFVHLRARHNVVHRTRDFDPIRFGSPEFNPVYWKLDDAGLLQPLADDPTKAYADLVDNAEKYRMMCAQITLLILKGASRRIHHDYGAGKNDWVPGDVGFIENSFPPPNARGVEGENIICVGKDQFWGHADPSRTLKLSEWLRAVNGWTREWGATASLDHRRTRPDDGLKQ